jgi:RNA polymerase sigma-70 factor (ECF subfamily)
MSADQAVFAQLQHSRREFLALVGELRPQLHRYCARMTGSITDGEDVVQDTLARAYFELGELKEMPAMRAWLFRIAHNRALDFLRRYDVRMGEQLDTVEDTTASETPGPEDALERDQAVHAAVSRFLELVPAQRSCVILKDVLGHSAEEIAALTGQSEPAVKAALHRGRARLRDLAQVVPPAAARPVSAALTQYATLFNARDWDGVRAMLVDEVRLDLVSTWKAEGRERVGNYFGNYGGIAGWRAVPGWLDGREVLAVFGDECDARPDYFIELTMNDGRVAAIRDFRHVDYIGSEAAIVLAER